MKLNRKPLLQVTMALAALSLFVFAVPSHATAVIDFLTGDAGDGGTIVISSTGVVGTNIPIDNINVTGAPVNNGVYEVTGTGNDATDGNPPGAGVLNFSCTGTTQTNCSATNSFTVTGSIPSLAGFTLGTNVTLLTGAFSSVGIVTNQGLGGQGSISLASGLDTKNATLLSDLGLTGLTFDFLGSSTGIEGTFGPSVGTYSYIGDSTDFNNTAVPEPASLLLMGSGLLALGIVLRKKLLRPASAPTTLA